jgi:flagellar basal-body rod protein FlgB
VGITDFPLFKFISGQMKWLVERQKVITQNVTNLNTQRFRAQDIKPLSFRDHVKPKSSTINMASTHKGHLQTKNASNHLPVKTFYSGTKEDMTPMGNDVNLEKQLMTMDETRQHYQLLTQLYKKNSEFIKIALGSGSQ